MIRYFLFLLITANVLSQINHTDSLLSKINEIKLPLVIDDLTFIQITKSNPLNYDKFKELLVSDDKEFQINIKDTISSKLYSLGKFYNKGKLNLLLAHHFKNDKEDKILIYLLNYYLNDKLCSYDIIAYKTIINNIVSQKISLLSTNSIVSYNSKNNIDNEIIYNVINLRKRFPYDSYYCQDKDTCVKYIPKLDSLPERKMNCWSFDKTFFNKNLKLMPYKYFSIDSTTQTLFSIGNDKKVSVKNYFLDSKKLKNGKIIVFFLNDYVYNNYKIVKEVGYQIFNEDGKLNKQKQIALYHIDKEGIESAFLSKVHIDGNELKIESGYSGLKKEKEAFELLKTSSP